MFKLFKSKDVVGISVDSSDCPNEYKKRLKLFIGLYDSLYEKTIKVHEFNNVNEKVAFFSLIYYLLEMQIDEEYFASSVNDKKDYLRTYELAEKFHEIVLDALIKYRKEKLNSISPLYSLDDFDKRVEHLHSMEVIYQQLYGKEEFLNEYLLYFLFTDSYEGIEPYSSYEEKKIQFEKIEATMLDQYDRMQMNRMFIKELVFKIINIVRETEGFKGYFFMKTINK